MAQESSISTLHIRGVSTTLGSQTILEQLDMPDLPMGSLVALLGPNGSGKSTLLKSIAGLLPATLAALDLGKIDLNTLGATERAEHVRYLPQSLPGDVHLTVLEALLVALQARGQDRHARLRPAHAIASVEAILHDLGIAALGPRYLDELSGGQKQLVGLAQALIHEPAVLLLDEPLASLDLNYQHHVMHLLRRLTRTRGLLTILVLHDLNIALRYADYALLMKQGTLLASGAPQDVINPDILAKTFSIRARIETCSLGYPCVLVDDLIQI
ncbi:ABC transporter ATP-binding protein [Paralcaligenes sp. KSB-10]|uniref:ABC transporter ATP-binding protein n=1 Tax=Paralcaligenes sp. KSB-10 TaxID=2901142 RepID=UPI001E53A2FC|nr:ABC transporter ATP-binding protein [Paralcaligenes sp. KSB-10]UHL64321.1 ABC transporter ATP-binding protein [Paralcaligenes sp. KSB-10]